MDVKSMIKLIYVMNERFDKMVNKFDELEEKFEKTLNFKEILISEFES